MPRHGRLLLLSVILVVVQLPLLSARAQPVGSAPALATSRKGHGQLSARLAVLAQVQAARVGQRADRSVPLSDAAVLGEALSLPVSGPGSLITNHASEVLVYVQLTDPSPAAFARLQRLGAHLMHVSPQYGMLTAYVAPSQLMTLATMPGVRFVQEALAPKRPDPATPWDSRIVARGGTESSPCPGGRRVSEGDDLLQAARARAQFGVDGSGVTVGVLSGSYDVTTETDVHAAEDIASGDLPGPANPCGRITPVQVVAETRLGAGRDEGRAMLQIVHDLAPGAQLAFATASDGLFAFAENIRRLRREAHADVLVDDYYYPEEPFFQDGPITVAINDVTAAGAIYVTAGGNIHLADAAGNAIGSYEAASYRPAACSQLLDNATGEPFEAGTDCHDFDPSSGVDTGMDIALPSRGSVTLNLQWSEPWFGVRTDLDVYLVDERNQVVAQSANQLGPAPYEFFAYTNTGAASQTVRLVLARFTGGTPRLKFTVGTADIYAVPLSRLEYADVPSADRFGPTVTDHAASANAITVAAVSADEPNRVEPFSSYGPATIYWAPVESIRPAMPLAAPEVRAKPDIAAPDGVQTTFYRRRALTTPERCDPAASEDVCRFFGTSASAPHIAAVVALMQQRAQTAGVGLDQARAAQLLQARAEPPASPPAAQGVGLANALGAVEAVTAAQAPATPGTQRMPNVVGLGEGQAKARLLEAGVGLAAIIVDYQDRAKLGALFDQVPAYTVVSTLPGSDSVLEPGQPVVFGVRAP